MNKTLLLTPTFCLLFFLYGYSQATVPAPFDMSGGAAFSLLAYTGAAFPTNMAIGTENNPISGTFTTPLTTDATHGTAPGKWNDEATNGISYKGGSAAERGSFLLALNTTDRQDITVDWKVRDINPDINTNFIELQYRVGNSGNFSDVTGDLYQQGTTPNGTTFTLVLPAAVNNQALVYVRWIYYEVGNGICDRLAIDQISVSSIVLPIELSRFEAQVRDNTVNLVWETQTERNNARFVIERSTNGRDFRALESVAGAGNSLVPLTYQYTDRRPLPGRSYYRLQQVDFDGQFSFSPVRQVTVTGNSALRLAPTLASSTLAAAMDSPFPTDMRWTIFDQSGHLVLSGLWPAEMTDLRLNITDLRPGNYMLQVGEATQRFVKQ